MTGCDTSLTCVSKLSLSPAVRARRESEKESGREGEEGRGGAKSVFMPDVSLARPAFATVECGRLRVPGISAAGTRSDGLRKMRTEKERERDR